MGRRRGGGESGIPAYLFMLEGMRQGSWLEDRLLSTLMISRVAKYFLNVKTKLCDSCSCRRLSDLLKAKKGQYLPV